MKTVEEVQALGKSVIFEPIEASRRSAGGLILEGDNKSGFQYGRVISAGPDAGEIYEDDIIALTSMSLCFLVGTHENIDIRAGNDGLLEARVHGDTIHLGFCDADQIFCVIGNIHDHIEDFEPRSIDPLEEGDTQL